MLHGVYPFENSYSLVSLIILQQLELQDVVIHYIETAFYFMDMSLNSITLYFASNFHVIFFILTL